MALDELVENLKTYEMNIENFKRGKGNKEKSLALKVFDSEGSDLDNEQVTFITKHFKKFMKKGKRYDKKDQVVGVGLIVNHENC